MTSPASSVARASPVYEETPDLESHKHRRASTVGGGAPVVVQSMTKTDTRDVAATVRQIRELEECGCELVRLAVPDVEAAKALRSIKRRAKVPLIADIHFDYRLALAALEAGVDGLRLNPGNISDPDQVAAVVKSARARKVPIRIGVNAGSLPRHPKHGPMPLRPWLGGPAHGRRRRWSRSTFWRAWTSA